MFKKIVPPIYVVIVNSSYRLRELKNLKNHAHEKQ